MFNRIQLATDNLRFEFLIFMLHCDLTPTPHLLLVPAEKLVYSGSSPDHRKYKINTSVSHTLSPHPLPLSDFGTMLYTIFSLFTF